MNKVDERQIKMSIKRRYMTSLSVQIVLVLVFAIGLYLVSSNSTPKVMRTVIPDKVTLPERSPSVENLISWRNELKLSNSQVNQLTDIQSKLNAEVGPLNRKIEEQTEIFQSKINQSGKRLSFAEIARAAQPAIELGRKRRLIEDGYADEAMSLLSKEQKGKALVLFKEFQKQKEREAKRSDGS